MSDLERMLAEEAEHAEQHRDDPVPAGMVGTRPSRARSAMLSLRLNPEELAAVQDLARERDVPASALVRGWILERLAAEHATPSDAAAAVRRLEDDIRTLRKFVAS